MKTPSDRIQYYVGWHIWNSLRRQTDAQVPIGPRMRICELICDPDQPMPPDPVLEIIWETPWSSIYQKIYDQCIGTGSRNV